jgi:hypothetical protein
VSWRVLLLVFALLLTPGEAAADGITVSRISLGPVGGNAPTPAKYVGPWGDNSSARWGDDARFSTNHWFMRTPLAEGTGAYFTTSEPLVAADTDGLRDLYRNDGSQTELVTTGPGTAGPDRNFCGRDIVLGACPFESSPDTAHAFFAFEEPLVPEDTDGGHNDVYRRFAGTTDLFTTGPASDNGPFDVCTSFGYPCNSFWVSSDGERLVFETPEKLVPEDSECAPNSPLFGCDDLYERDHGVTRLLTTGPLRSPGESSAYGIGLTYLHPFPVSLDARHVFFITEAALVPEDRDTRNDIYESFDGATRLVSTGPFNSDAPADADWRGASADGTRSYFWTNAALTSDSARGRGNYERAGGVTRRLPLGPPSDPFNTDSVSLYGPSYDGTHVFFSSSERLTPADTDNRRDLYSYSAEGIELVSTGPAGGKGAFDTCPGDGFGPCLEAASRDGTVVYFTTEEPLVASDTDDDCPKFVGQPYPCEDIYKRDLTRNTTELVSTGPGPSDGIPFDFLFLDAISVDGSRAFFRTEMPLVPQDTDREHVDIYEHSSGRTQLLSTGPLASNEPVDAIFGGSTADARTVFFDTAELLVQGDGDFGWTDVYRADLNEPPDCSGVTASRPVLQHNRRLVWESLEGATDPDGDPVALAIDGVTQDEPVTGRGDHTAPDAVLKGDGDLVVRAERSPSGDGRVYRIAFTAADGHGGSCSGAAAASVPRKKKKPAVDSAPPSYDSLAR